jgi:DNA recombination protein RmuC
MDFSMEAIYILSGLAAGIIVTWFILKNKFDKERGLPQPEADALRNKINDLSLEKGKADASVQILQQNLDTLHKEITQLRDINTNLNSNHASLNSDYQNLLQRHEEYKQEVEKLREKFTAEFKLIANDLLDEKSRKFTEQNKTNIDEILRPLKEKIKNFEEKVENVYRDDSKERAGLIQQIKSLHELNQQMTKEAANLTSALKGQTKTRGNWGEFILESILEKSGLVKGREYQVQQSFSLETSKRLQPDIVIYLPEGKHLVIDSKVSLVAYERYCTSESEMLAAVDLKDHINSIRKHIKDLSSKNYQNLYQIKTLDFVLLFMPIEPAFSLAVQNDPEMFNEAFEQNIVIVSPSTLLATLRTIASIWRQEHQNKNALEIARQGGAMYDKICSIVEDMTELGRKISAAGTTHEEVMRKLHTGGGNLLRKAENMKKLGAKTTKSISPTLLDKTDDDNPEDFLLEENKSNGS